LMFLVPSWGLRTGMFVLFFLILLLYNNLRVGKALDFCSECELKENKNCVQLSFGT